MLASLKISNTLIFEAVTHVIVGSHLPCLLVYTCAITLYSVRVLLTQIMSKISVVGFDVNLRAYVCNRRSGSRNVGVLCSIFYIIPYASTGSLRSM